MKERNIGKVISVDSFRVFIRLDEELKSLYKSGYEDIYEVARINSYIIIPIGADKIVAMVTSVRAVDETDLGRNKEAIFLTKAARYLIATMMGTIENTGRYIQGVYNYPILDNPVWYVTREDLDNIFDQKEKEQVNFEEDFYLPIGTSPAFSDYRIKINPDKFFGKHTAILGNTGSGKSCTLASIIQSLFEYDYNIGKLKSAHIIIFDTNGEYKSAFHGTKGKSYKNLNVVNPFYINKHGTRVPFWFMNFDDYEYLFEPTSGTQSPILKRAIALAKGNELAILSNEIPPSYISWITSLINFCDDIDNYWKLDNYKIPDYLKYLKELSIDYFDLSALVNTLQKMQDIKPSGANKYDKVDINKVSECKVILQRELDTYNNALIQKRSTQNQNIDLPIRYDFEELIGSFFDSAIEEQETSNNRIKEFVSTLKLRLQSYYNDERIATPLLLNTKEQIDSALAKFIAFILGDYCKVYNSDDTDLYSKYYQDQLSKKDVEKLQSTSPSQVSIIDMSLLPYEVLETVTGLIGRLILEFASRLYDRGSLPTVIVLEEAQNYIPETNRGQRESISKRVFERVAREGRKYGISLVVSSQRPSELSKTVLSQCNSFIVHRLQNPEDQKYVRQLVSAANEDILQQLPILPQQHVIIMGDAVRTPVQAKMNNANPKPNSSNPKFIENWIKEPSKDFPNYKKISEAWEKGEKYIPDEAE